MFFNFCILEKYEDEEKRRPTDDRTTRRRHRDRYYDEEGYGGGPRSQNTSDREYDRFSHRSRGYADAQGYYQQQQQYGYDPNYNYTQYYQQQHYFNELRRTNPQAYEWYKNYYSGMMQQQQAQMPQPTEEIGGSIRSGYSSSTEKDRYSLSDFFLLCTMMSADISLSILF